MSNQILRYGVVIAGAVIVAVLALKLVSRGGHSVANTAAGIEQKF